MSSHNNEEDKNALITSFGDKQIVDSNIQKCMEHVKAATSFQEQTCALDELRQQIIIAHAIKNNNAIVDPKKSSLSLPLSNFEILDHVAMFIVKDVAVDIHDNYYNVLDVCGMIPTLSACCKCLKEIIIASNNDKTNKKIKDLSSFSTTTFQVCLSTIRRILLPLVLLDPAQQQQVTIPTIGWSKSSSSTTTTTLVMNQFISMILSFPYVIANACHALQTGLPTWAIPELFDTAIVQSALYYYSYQQTTVRLDDTKNHKNDNDWLIYIQTLIRQLIQSRGSTSCDNVAKGIISDYCNYCQRLQDKKQRDLYYYFIEVTKHLSDKDSAMLLRSIIRQCLVMIPVKNITTMSIHDIAQEYLEQYLIPICLSELLSSLSMQQEFIRICMLSYSSCMVGSKEWMDPIFCHVCMCLIAKCCDQQTNKTAMDDCNNAKLHIEETESDTDSDNDDDATTTMNHNLLSRCMNELSGTWSQTTFVQQTDQVLQQHVTYGLLSAIVLLDSQAENDNNNNNNNNNLDNNNNKYSIPTTLLQGVSARLESSNKEVRIHGMVIAEQFAKQLGQPLSFEELTDAQRNAYDIYFKPTDTNNNIDNNSDNSRMTTNDKASSSIATAIPSQSIFKQQTNTDKKINKKVVQPVDPDASYISSDEENDEDYEDNKFAANFQSNIERHETNDSPPWNDRMINNDKLDDPQSSSLLSTSLFIPYDLQDDEEDLRDTPKPLYLIDCLELLRTPESQDTAASDHETAIIELPKLIRQGHFVNLPDLAIPLAQQILRMENKFDIENFESHVFDGLCALTVAEPILVGQNYLIQEELFDIESGGLSHRLTILGTLNHAAMELSGLLTISNNNDNNNNNAAKRSIMQDPANNNHNNDKTGKLPMFHNEQDPSSLIVSKIESQTRRKRSPRPKNNIITNKFRAIASTWFYNLLGLFVQHKAKVDLWKGNIGSQFLAKLFLSLSCIVECSEYTPGVQVMARDLFELVWSFRTAEISDIRSAVLVAVAISMARMDDQTVLQLLLTTTRSKNNDNSIGGGSTIVHCLEKMAKQDPDKSCRQIASALSKEMLEIVESMKCTPLLLP